MGGGAADTQAVRRPGRVVAIPFSIEIGRIERPEGRLCQLCRAGARCAACGTIARGAACPWCRRGRKPRCAECSLWAACYQLRVVQGEARCAGVLPDARGSDRTPVVEGVIPGWCGRRMRLPTRTSQT